MMHEKEAAAGLRARNSSNSQMGSHLHQTIISKARREKALDLEQRCAVPRWRRTLTRTTWRTVDLPSELYVKPWLGHALDNLYTKEDQLLRAGEEKKTGY
jgi:hypothetical protein